jgi:uncharacterized membrane protein
MPFNPRQLLGLVLVVGLVLAFIQVGILTVAFEKLGLSSHSAFMLLFASLFGSAINLPVMKVKAERPSLEDVPEQLRELMAQAMRKFQGQTTIAVNTGGCLIPLMFSYYLIHMHRLEGLQVIAATLIVTVVSRLASRPIPGVGIGMPIFIAPLVAAITAVGIAPDNSAPLAYICGTLGVLIGADLMRLKDVRKMGVPMASIGGAGTFDGIFITGIVAVLLS